MTNVDQGSAITQRILGQLTDDVRKTFTPAQIAALQAALTTYQNSRHPIDMRCSIPLPGQTIYLVFVAGVSRRSRQRARAIRHGILGRAALLAGVLIGCGLVLGLVRLRWFYLPPAYKQPLVEPAETFYPTVVPYKQTRRECELSGRRWQNHQCIDEKHDPSF
jgi:hypothetical protein